MSGSRLLWVLFVAYLVATAIHIGFVMAHEPFSFDAWNVAVDTEANPISASGFFEYWQHQYAHSNPRIGQPLAYLAYKVAWFAEIATPLAYLALTLAITVIGLGRWPKRGRELALWIIAIGFGWFVFPQIGRNMFCRAYGANYVYTAAIQLWFVARLRLFPHPAGASTLQCIEYATFGLIAGMCNEHTGPALVMFLAGYAWWQHRAGERPRLAIAGGIGALIGFAAILFAPGQGERYDGLAQQASLFGRVVERGVSGNLGIFRDYVVYAAPLLGLFALVLVHELATRTDPVDPDRRMQRTRAARLIALALLAGVVITATLWASPKLGSRFYIAPLALLLAGFVALLDAVVEAPRRLVPFVVLAVIASTYAGLRTIPLFDRVAEQGAARMAALAASEPGSVFVADGFEQRGESWWFIGDDFRSASKREMVKRYFGLARVTLRAKKR